MEPLDLLHDSFGQPADQGAQPLDRLAGDLPRFGQHPVADAFGGSGDG